MRFLSVLTLVAVLLALFSTGNVISAQGGDLTVTVTQNAVIRGGPDTSFDRLGSAPAGSVIRLDGRNENGNWVRGITSGGVIGWVSSGTLNIGLGELGNLPIISITAPFTLSAPAAPSGPAPQTAPAAAGAGGSGMLVNATTNVNMRSGPGTSFARVGGVQSGAPFNVDGRDTASNWVRGINQAGVVGWVSANFVTIGDTISGLPVVSNETPFNLAPPPGGAPAAAAAAAPLVGTSPVRGFSYGGHVQTLNDFSAGWMHRAGMTWVKKQWRYYDGQNAGSVAGLINDAHARGFRIMVGVVGSPAELNSPGYFERYAAFVGGVAGLGADAIEVWNEPNIDREWPAGQISPQMYTNLLRVSYNAIKAANPNTLVVSGAPAPTGFFGGCSGAGCDDNLFVSGMAAAGAASYMDCIGIHYNEGIVPPNWTSGDPRGASTHYTRYFRSMMDVYYNAFRGSRPLCFTELGYLTPEGYGPLPVHFAWAADVTVTQQAAWLREAISIARSSGRVRVAIIWNVDFTNYGADPMAGYAMIRPGGGCPACEALGR